MKKHYIGLFVVTMGLLATQLWAKTLTLQECLEQARANNPSLKIAAWDTAIAGENVRLIATARYPRVDLQAGYTMQQSPQAVKINNITAETQEPDFAFAGVAANYTIYDFGRRDARIQQARLRSDSTAKFFEARCSDVSMQVIETYFGILESGKLVAAAEEEVAQVEQHRKVAQALFEEGVVTCNDVLQADVRLAAARQNLLAVKNRRENIWLQLNFLTGTDQTFRGELDEKAGMAAIDKVTGDIGGSIDHRYEIQALRKSVEAGEADVTESRSHFYPEVYSRLAMEYVQNDKVNEPIIMSATIGIKFNLFDGYASTSARERALLSHSRSRDALRQTEAQVRLEVATAQNDVRVAQDRIAVTETAIRQSEENLRINKERYQERVGTATEVLDAQTLLTKTKTDFFRAVFDHQVASARLKRAIGEL